MKTRIIFPILLLLFYTHYDKILFGYVGVPSFAHISLNAISIFLDTCVLYLFCTLCKRLKVVRALFLFLFVSYCIANVIYHREFSAYFNIRLVSEYQNLVGLGDSVVSLFCWRDFVVFPVAVFFLYRFRDAVFPKRKILLPVLCLVLYCFPIVEGAMETDWVKWNAPQTVKDGISNAKWGNYSIDRNGFVFTRGLFVSLCADLKFSNALRELTEHDVSDVATLNRRQYHVGGRVPQNLILIMAESLNSSTIGCQIDGQEATPFLSSLQKDSTIYLNRYCESKEGLGKSSDGQFVVMSGILPYSRGITISSYSRNKVSGLGNLFKARGNETLMVIPTSKEVWRQTEACLMYGIDSLYSSSMAAMGETRIMSYANDSTTFALAERILDKSESKPFFLTILTASTHEPYNMGYSQSRIKLESDTISAEYLTYLEKVNYFDYHLGEFMAHLKAMGLYDNTMIVIIADHKAPLDYQKNQKSKDTPLIIINSGLPPSEMPDESMRICQQDIYPTLLDLWNLTPQDFPWWRGVGYSIFATSEEREMPEQRQQELSNVLLETDYFRSVKKDME